MPPTGRIVGLAWLVLVTPAVCAGEGSGMVQRVPRTGGVIHVDGRLDEPAWNEALVLSLDHEIYPSDNGAAPFRTECRILYDGSFLYLGFRAFDPEPGTIRTYLAGRDDLPGDEDQVQFVLDTFDDQRRAYAFSASPLGAQWDAIASEVGGIGLSYDTSWDGLWEARGAIDDQGYVIEVAVPFATLRFPRGGEEQTWGLHLARIQPRSVVREVSLQPIDRSNNCYLCQEAKITGFEGVKTGLNLELDPTFTATRSDERLGFPDGPMVAGPVGGDLGLTTRWTPVPDLTLSAAANPDFSQVEADIAQLKINRRFALYYPEKRPLFLEGADYFQTRLSTIYTRTIADPSWGGKLVGKTGGNAVGALVARDRITNLLFPANQVSASTSLDEPSTTGAVRYRRDVGSSSTLGLLLTDREGEDYSNRVLGADSVIRLSAEDTLSAQTLVSRTRYPEAVAQAFDQPDGAFKGTAVSLGYQHESKLWNWGLSGSDLGPDLRADTGFITRVDTRTAGASLERVFWGDPAGGAIRLSVGASGNRTEDHQGALTDQSAGVFFRWDGPLQSSLSVDYGRSRELFAGDLFDETSATVSFGVTPKAGLSAYASATWGDEVDYANVRLGRGLSLSPGLSLKLGRHLKLNLDETYETLEVDGGRLYRASLLQARAVWQFTVRSMARIIVQSTGIRSDPALSVMGPPPDPVTRDLFTQALYSYRTSPQTAFYLGYSESRDGTQDIPLTQADRAFFFKIGYAFLP